MGKATKCSQQRKLPIISYCRIYTSLNGNIVMKSILNNAVGVNTFDLSNNADSTINNWKEKLNGIYNK